MKSNPIKKLVKEIRFKTDMNLNQIAEAVGYNKAYFRNAVSGGKSPAVLKRLQTKFNDIIDQNATPDSIEVSSEAGEEIGKIHEQLIFLKASVRILGMNISELLAAKNGLSVTKAALELEQTISEEVNRLLFELRKKSA